MRARGRALAWAATLPCLVAASAVIPGAAHGAALEPDAEGRDLRFAGSLSPSSLTVTWDAERTLAGELIYSIRFRDTVDPPHPAPGSGCVSETPDTVSCLLSGRPSIAIHLGDGDDELHEISGSGDGPPPEFFIYGGRGHDSIEGGSGPDRISGGSGRDTLLGRAGTDRIIGGPGRDRLRGNSGADVLRGKAGGDRLDGGSEADALGSGPGEDLVISDDGVTGERVNCGRHEDRVRPDLSDRLYACEDVRDGRALPGQPRR